MKTLIKKTPKVAFVFSIAAVFVACQKEAKTKPVSFESTDYKVLVAYDSSNGKPKNLLHDQVSPNLLSFISSTLPEGKDLRGTNPGLLENSITTDLKVTQKSDVYLTFLSKVTKFTNSIAFYTYPTSTPPTNPKDIKTITYVFPNTGVNTALQAGDKLKIGNFPAGTSIGLVLLKDGFNSSNGSLNNGAVHFCYNDALNPEVNANLKKHVVLIPYQPQGVVLIGFEDTDRTSSDCDHDFNDVVLYATIE